MYWFHALSSLVVDPRGLDEKAYQAVSVSVHAHQLASKFSF